MLKTSSCSNCIKAFLVVLMLAAANWSATAITNHDNAANRYSSRTNALIQQSGDTLKVGMAIEGINTATPGKITLNYKYDASVKKAMPVSKKLIVVNGKAVEAGTIGGLEGSEYMIILTPDQGVKKYGKKGELGVIEANGPQITLIAVPSPPPSGPPPSYE